MSVPTAIAVVSFVYSVLLIKKYSHLVCMKSKGCILCLSTRNSRVVEVRVKARVKYYSHVSCV